MKDDKKERIFPDVSRRQFLGTSAAIAAGAMVGDQLFPRELRAVSIPNAWDQETEVLVIGTGYTGLVAAIEAHDVGSKVVILEKNPFLGGNSITASGGFNAVDPERQKKQGIEDSIDLHYRQTLAGGDYRGEPEKVRYLAEHALEGIKWLESIGVEFEPTVYTIVGSLYPRSHDPVKHGRGAAIVKALKSQVDKRNIPILLQHKLTGIVREKPLEEMVAGAEVDNKGKKLHFKAKKAVVLGTGGFSANVQMRSKYDPRLTAEVPTTNVPTAIGDATLIAEDMGGDVIGMDYIQLLIACNYFTKKYGSLANLGIDSAVFVNTKGVRFVAEDARRDVMSDALFEQPMKLLIWVADDRCAKRYDAATIERLVKEKLVFQTNSLADMGIILNEKFKIPPDTFLETMRKYNEAAAKGVDKEFGKNATNLKAVEVPPFFASPTQAGVHHTMGGLRTQGATGQVLDRHGNVIPRLYAAGEGIGGVHGTNRLGGNATAACIVFGRVAGRNAAAERPWA